VKVTVKARPKGTEPRLINEADFEPKEEPGGIGVQAVDITDERNGLAVSIVTVQVLINATFSLMKTTGDADSLNILAQVLGKLTAALIELLTRWSLAGKKAKLTEAEKLLIATVCGESIEFGEFGWKCVTWVIKNRVGKKYWVNQKTVTAVITAPGQFDAYLHPNVPYRGMMSYLNNRDGSNQSYEKLISVVLSIYRKTDTVDPTKGCNFYYSPKYMVPSGSAPSWASSYEYIPINGIDPWNLKFYKY